MFEGVNKMLMCVDNSCVANTGAVPGQYVAFLCPLERCTLYVQIRKLCKVAGQSSRSQNVRFIAITICTEAQINTRNLRISFPR